MASKKITRFSEDMPPEEAEQRLVEQSEAAREAWNNDKNDATSEHMHEVMTELQAARAYWRGIREALGQPSIVTQDHTTDGSD